MDNYKPNDSREAREEGKAGPFLELVRDPTTHSWSWFLLQSFKPTQS